jgi:hypothetical protein
MILALRVIGIVPLPLSDPSTLIADHRVMRSSDGEGRSIRSDALYPALSGEWEVPVTRNAKGP